MTATQKVFRLAEFLLLAIFSLLVFTLFFEDRVSVPNWLKVAGRMHPMFLHFPIVLVFLSLLSWWMPSEQFTGWTRALLLVAAVSAVITAEMGLLLSLEESREGRAFTWHKWTGFLLAAFAFLAYHAYPLLKPRPKAGKVFSLLVCVLVIVAGHYGAVLTHGKDYLTAPIASTEKVPVDKAVVFDDIIQPLFSAKCASCHGADNIKGGLDLETVEGVLAGGKTGPLFKKGDPSISLLMHRLLMAPGEKKHMPPASKPQLTENEIELLRAWIRSGAAMKEHLIDLPVQDSFRMIASTYLNGQASTFDQPVFAFDAADPALIKKLNNNFRVIEQLGNTSPALSVHFYGKDNYSTAALKDLLPLREQITELSLARLPVSDEDLSIIAQFEHLNTLNLNYSAVTDKGLEKLLKLEGLQSVSLSGTRVGTGLIRKLSGMPQMNSVFIWNTALDSLQVAALQKTNPNIFLESGFKDDGKSRLALPPPQLETPGGVVQLPSTIAIKHPVKGAVIRYTLDGSSPDSISSAIYSAPVKIDSNTTITAKAFKDDWYSSSEVRAQYIRKGKKPDSIKALTQPDYRYKNPPGILSDGDLGEMRYQNGGWLAYQTNDAIYELIYKKPVDVSSVSLNMYEHNGAQIFRPAKVEVWDISNPAKQKLLGNIRPALPDSVTPVKIRLEKIEFPQATVQKLRINIQHLNKLPSWHKAKGNPGWVLISEILVN